MEVAQGPSFGMVWCRFVSFVETLQRLLVTDESDSDYEDAPVVLPFEIPTVILAAHNGIKFDYPMILSECQRHGCNRESLEDWLFVDILPMWNPWLQIWAAVLSCNALCAGIERSCKPIVLQTTA